MYLFSYIAAIPEAPKAITIDTTSVLLEFRRANDTASNYRVQFKEVMVGSSGQYTSTYNVKVESVSGQMTYTVIQDGLIPGRKYKMRIVPNVRHYTTDYPGVPSDDVEVDTLVPGKERVGDKITP